MQFLTPESIPNEPFRVKVNTIEEANHVRMYFHRLGYVWGSGMPLNNFRHNPPNTLRPDHWLSPHPAAGKVYLTVTNDNGPDLTHLFFSPEVRLTNEQIFVQFLKHHRKFSEFCRSVGDCSNPPIELAVQGTLPAKHWHLHSKWEALIRQFGLTGHIDVIKATKL